MISLLIVLVQTPLVEFRDVEVAGLAPVPDLAAPFSCGGRVLIGGLWLKTSVPPVQWGTLGLLESLSPIRLRNQTV